MNVEKSNFVIFHPLQKKVNYSMKLKTHNNEIKEENSVKYLGIIMDCNLNWKDHIFELSKKISRGIGISFKLRDFVSINILNQVYYSLISLFLTYAVLVWEHTYKSNLHPLVVLQKKAMRIMTDDFWLFSFFLSISYCVLFLLAYGSLFVPDFFSRVLKKA